MTWTYHVACPANASCWHMICALLELAQTVTCDFRDLLAKPERGKANSLAARCLPLAGSQIQTDLARVIDIFVKDTQQQSDSSRNVMSSEL